MDEKERIEKVIIPLFGNWRIPPNFKELPVKLIAGVEACDDCTVLNIEKPTTIVMTTDFVRGAGFDLYKEGLLSFYDLGYFLIIANISDITAMGAIPFGLLTVVRYPPEMSDEDFREIFEGMKAAAKKYDAVIIGGDTGGFDRLVLSATALGVSLTGKPLMRSGAKSGDMLCVSGPVGGAATALSYYRIAKKRGFKLDDVDEETILKTWKQPQARVVEGRILAENEMATSCQDVSDGLKITVAEIGQSSHVGTEIFEENVPILDATRKVADFLGIDPYRLAFSASVDFELVFSVPPEKYNACQKLFLQNACELHKIGVITSTPEHKFRRKNGDLQDLPGIGWKHQLGDIATLLSSPDLE